ncbi:1724_t:CDS:1, partial [Racocetra fulgida]
ANERGDIKILQKREYRTLVTKFVTTSSYTTHFKVTSCSNLPKEPKKCCNDKYWCEDASYKEP